MIHPDSVLSILMIAPDVDEAQPWLPDLGQPADVCDLQTIWNRLQVDIPDLVIAAACDDPHVNIFAALHDSYSLRQRPAIVVFTNDMPPDYGAALVDAVLPQFDHPLVPLQIRQVVERKNRLASMEERVAGLEATNRDLVRRQTARQRSEYEIDVLKNAIVRNVAHELNTPLLHVKSAVSLIAEEVDNTTLVNYATTATGRLEGVVKNITQLAASLNDVRMAPMILNDSIDSALRELRRTWENKDQVRRVKVDIESDLPLIYADRQGIAAVLQQLIDNGVKFSKKSVEVTARLRGDHVRISVRDYGIGIPADQRDVIFESFYQVDPSSRRSHGGTGVGLAIVRLILDRHGTDIQLKSEVKKGSTFTFSLPIAGLPRAKK
jgi:signal transduction histidine kinase